jgi:hypothetical protein
VATIIGTRKGRLFLGASPTEYTSEVSNVRIIAGEKDSDFMSYAEANTGGAREYKLALTIRQDTAAASLWYMAWNAAVVGTDVAYEFWPNGQNTVSPTTPTATYPKLSGSVTITEPDGDFLGGEANKSATAVNVTEVEWVCTAKPTLSVA